MKQCDEVNNSFWEVVYTYLIVFIEPSLSFNPENPFPTPSTCAAVELILFTKYSDDYLTFKKMLDIAFTCHGGFGKT